jgi:nucleoside-diphosphate-sugar epimerase
MRTEAEEKFAGRSMVVFGCGYLGGHVARRGVELGMQVAGLTRNPVTARELESAGIRPIVAALEAETWHTQLKAPVDYVVNAVSSGGGGVDGYRRSYLAGMESIQRWTETIGAPRRFVYTSSTSVYPQGNGERVDENAVVDARDERAAVLIEAERVAARIPRSTILRLAGIYGPARVSLIERVRTGVVSGEAGDHLNLIHRDDAASAVWWVLGADDFSGGVFNVVDDAPSSRAEVTSWIASELGVPAPTFSPLASGSRRALTPDRVILNARLKTVLGWAPSYPTYREGYAKFLSR